MKPIEIAEQLQDMTKVNIFDNSRKQDIVDVRSLLCYLLREKLNMRWTNIARFFNENGKNMTHATVMHCVKKYPSHKKANKDLARWEKVFTWKSDLTYDEIDKIYYLESQVRNLKQKVKDIEKYEDLLKNLKEKLEHPLVHLIKELPEKRYDETYERLRNITRSYEWKYKDKKIVQD
tara:strand:- start:815 stop:1345 length:531 start_codon:yes stop_codon:yes gene_type:complete